LTFDLLTLRFHFVATASIHFPEGTPANLLRGALGARLHQEPSDYGEIFRPKLSGGPSGLADSPRPFVFRARGLDGRTVAPGQAFDFAVNVFDLGIAERFVEAMSGLKNAHLKGVDQSKKRLNLEPGNATASFVTIEFLTPTELKSGEKIAARPDFPILFARIRDRISTLSALYGDGPLPVDFREMGDRAAQVRMTRCEIRSVELKRRSGAGTHPLGGFVGAAEYEGELSEFLPYLEAARWTGVGRQTVWGKGELQVRY
jgi:hypothetical protein